MGTLSSHQASILQICILLQLAGWENNPKKYNKINWDMKEKDARCTLSCVAGWESVANDSVPKLSLVTHVIG